MYDEVYLAAVQHILQLVRPQALGGEIVQCRDLVLVSHGTDGVDDVVVLRVGLFELLDDHVGLDARKEGLSSADVDGLGLRVRHCWGCGGGSAGGCRGGGGYGLEGGGHVFGGNVSNR